MPPEAARAFRLGGLLPGLDADAHAAAALTGSGLDQARRTQDLLARAHLIQPGSGGRYGMHDLLRAYAAGLAMTEDGEPEVRAAAGRLFDYYLAAAGAAMDRLVPAEAHRRPRVRPAGTPIPALADAATALAWLDAHRPTLVAVATHTANQGWPDHTVRLAATLYRYLAGSHHTDALAIHTHAQRAARQAGDPAGEAQALTGLGIVHMRLGRHERAAGYFEQALALFRQAGDRVGQARGLGNLGLVSERLGRYRLAAEHHQQALAAFRQADDQVGQAQALTSLGVVEQRLGRYGPAADQLGQAVTLSQQAGDRGGAAYALNHLAEVETRQGRYRLAAEHHQQALLLYRQTGDRSGEAWALTGIGDLHTRLGQPDLATDHHHRALALFREIGDRDGQPWALNGLGEAAHAAGNPAAALTHHTAALIAADGTGARDQQARAHTGLGHAHYALAEPDTARDHLRHAPALHTELGTPETDRIRDQLAAVDRPPAPAETSPGPGSHRSR